jgi:hypothetical protein
MSWGQELAPLELQNTKGGDWLGILVSLGFLLVAFHFATNGGKIDEACNSAGEDLNALMNLIQEVLGFGAAT